jgi:hypothetical protein
MARILLLYVIPLALMIYAVADCVSDDNVDRTSLPKVAWIIIIILFPYIGPLAWIAAAKIARPRGRQAGWRGQQWPPGRPAPRLTALPPDDDPDYLRQLAEEQALRERQRQRREKEKREGEQSSGEPSAPSGD